MLIKIAVTGIMSIPMTAFLSSTSKSIVSLFLVLGNEDIRSCEYDADRCLEFLQIAFDNNFPADTFIPIGHCVIPDDWYSLHKIAVRVEQEDFILLVHIHVLGKGTFNSLFFRIL